MELTYNVRNIAEEKNIVFYTNFDFVENELKLPKEIFEQHLHINREDLYGQYGDNERNVLFNMVAWLKPKKIIEFSPSGGYTTLVIAAATTTYFNTTGGLANHSPTGFDFFETHELEPIAIKETRRKLEESGFDKVRLVEGDVLQTMDLEKLKECDFFFIDSDHDKAFVEKYVEKFFHLIPVGTWVAIHDVAFDPPNGETEVITDWLKKNNRNKYFYVRDLANRFGVNDRVPNPWNPKDMETSTTLWFKNC